MKQRASWIVLVVAGCASSPSERQLAESSSTTLVASETCDVAHPGDDVRLLDPPATIVTPAFGDLSAGKPGHRFATLAWRDADGSEGICLYKEAGHAVRLSYCTTPQAFAAHGCADNPSRCADDAAVLAATPIPQGGAIFAATRVSLSLDDEPPCKPATVTLALLAPADRGAPTWPPGSTLAARDGRLEWTPATDDIGVVAYRLYQDGARIAEVNGSILSAPIPALPDGPYTFRVQATDAVGHESTDGPTLTITVDAHAPTWPPGSTLAVRDGRLEWTAATDAVEVTAYHVYQDGAAIAEVDGGTLSAPLPALGDGSYAFQVQALDAAGHESTDGPSTTLRIDRTPPTWPPGSILSATVSGPGTATLVWTAALDEVGVTAYRLYADGALVVETSGLSAQAPFATSYQVQAVDAAGNESSGGPSVTLRFDTAPPTWPAGSALDVEVTGAHTAHLSWTAATDDTAVAGYRLYADGAPIQTVPATDTDVIGLERDRTYHFQVQAFDAAGNESSGGPAADLQIGVPDPVLLAPPLDPTVSTTVFDATAFLYTGPDAIQTGVAPGTIERRRAVLVRGGVVDRAGDPVTGVAVAILGHPELGETRTRADGRFDLVVNGGGALTLTYHHTSYLAAQRRLEAGWDLTVEAPDVALTPIDEAVTQVETDAPMAQVARGAPVSDADGARQATILFPAGTTATDADGNPLATLHVHATEFTIGPDGRKAMPASLPPASAYTYAVDFSVEEAAAVTFNQPVFGYVENFIGLPVGGAVPSASYDPAAGVWVPSPNGRVIRLLAGGGIDSDGDGVADTALGMSDAERAELAALYPAGQTLWRVPMAHFSIWDWNLGWGPGGAGTPPTERATTENTEGCPSVDSGSVIECENRILGEGIALTGTGLSLHYTSLRSRARSVERTIKIPLTGAVVPTGVQSVRLRVDVAGQHFTQSFQPQPNQSTTFVWDGRDAYGRVVPGTMLATVEVAYVYALVYRQPAGFGVAGGTNYSKQITRVGNDVEAVLRSQVWVGNLAATPENSLGGWTLSAHHDVDVASGRVYHGDGGHEQKAPRRAEIAATVLSQSSGLAVGPDGTAYATSTGSGVVYRVRPDGVKDIVAGIAGVQGFSGDGGPAVAALLHNVTGVAVDGTTLYIVDHDNARIRRVKDGIIETFAGNGTSGTTGDGGSAKAASIAPNTNDIAIGPDGSLYFGERYRIRTVDTAGVIRTIAGSSCGVADVNCDTGDGGQAKDARLSTEGGLAVGADGSVVFGEKAMHVVRRIGPDGVIRRIAGNTIGGSSGDGGPALAASIGPSGVALSPTGDVFLAEDSSTIRRVGGDGLITTVAGSGHCTGTGTRFLPLQAPICGPVGLAIAPDTGLFVGGYAQTSLIHIRADGSDLGIGGFLVPSGDGALVYKLDGAGRHRQTLDTITGAALATFGYDETGRLERVDDGEGNIVTIERTVDGAVITAPFGQRTQLTFNPDGYLERVTDPLGESVTLTYTRGDLLASYSHPLTGTSTFTYDAAGRLQRDAAPDGGYKDYAETPLVHGRKVSRTTRLGRNATFERVENADGSLWRRMTNVLGLAQVVTRDLAGTSTSTAPDGTHATLATTADPRFGVDATQPTSSTATLPSGRAARVDYTQTVTLTTAADPLSVKTADTTAKLNNSRTLRTHYDAPTHTVTTTSPAGRQVQTLVDARGRPLKVTAPGVLPVTYTYDARGRAKTVTQGARQLTFDYDGAGRLETVTAPAGEQTQYTYDALDRPLTTVRPDGQLLQVAYENSGRRVLLTPPGKPAHVGESNPEEQTSRYAPPLVGDTSSDRVSFFDDDGLLLRETTADGETSTTRDAAGRLQTETTPRGTFTFGYLPNGHLQSVSTPEGVTSTLSRDGALVTGATVSGPVPGQVVYGYDADLRVNAETVNGSSVTFAYDADDLLLRAGDLTLTRNAQSGFVDSLTLHSVRATFGRNAYGELDDRAFALGSLPLWSSHVVTRDAEGRILSRQETVGSETHTYGYTYDVIGRLTDVSLDGIGAEHYEYDENGNRLLADRPDGSAGARYDAQDRLVTHGTTLYAYTPDGALESKTDATGATTSYTYDLTSNLLAVSLPGGDVVEYVLDPSGRRIARKLNGAVTHRWLYGAAAGPAAELDDTGAVTTRYIYATHAWVPSAMVRGGRTYVFVTDAIGSVRLVVDADSGDVAQRLDYDTFGRVTRDTNPGFQPFGFGGGLFDTATGLVRLGARDYDPAVGRWTTKDPIGFGGDGANLYAYVQNDAVNILDPAGTSPFWSAVKGVGESLFYNYLYGHPLIAPWVLASGIHADNEPHTSIVEEFQHARAIGDVQAQSRLITDGVFFAVGFVLCAAKAVPELRGPTESTLPISSALDGLRLAKKLATDAGIAELEGGGGETMAGAGTKTPIRDVPRLVAEHGGQSADWAKVTSSTFKFADLTTIEVHAYRNIASGAVVELKVKIGWWTP